MSIGNTALLLDIVDRGLTFSADQQHREDERRRREGIATGLGEQTRLGLEGRTAFGGSESFSGTSRTAGADPFGLGQSFDFSSTVTPFDPNNPNGIVDESQSFQGALGLRDLGLADIPALDEAFQAREARELGRLRGLGDVQRRDINQRFDTARGRELQALQNRGGGGFLASGLRLANDRQRNEELLRFNDSQNRQILDFSTQLSADTLNAQAAGNQQRLGLEALPVQTELGLQQQQLNFEAGAPLIPPGGTPFGEARDAIFDLRAQNAAAAVPSANRGSTTGQKVAAGGTGAATGLATGTALAPATAGLSLLGAAVFAGGGAALSAGAAGCLHGDSVLETAYGPAPIAGVEIGDAILCADDEFHRVIAIDSGNIPDTPDREKYVKMIAGFNELIVTVKHSVGGKPAGEWAPGEHIECFGNEYVVLTEPHDYVSGHDIMVEGDEDYVANGFVVTSVIGKIIADIGMDKWNELRGQGQPVGA